MTDYKNTDISSGQLQSVQIVTQACLNICQNITQGIFTGQLISINCTKKDNSCNDCIKKAQELNLEKVDFSQLCPSCLCTLENININAVVQLNLNSLQQTNLQSDFTNQISNSFTQLTTSSGTGFAVTPDDQNSLQSVSDNIWNNMQSSSFQSSLQQLKVFQILNLNTPNSNYINVDLTIATNFISNILQSDSKIAESLTQMDSTILNIMKSSTQGIIVGLISLIVKILLIAFIILILFFAIQQVPNLLNTYLDT
jgi:hypothetical protein